MEIRSGRQWGGFHPDLGFNVMILKLNWIPVELLCVTAVESHYVLVINQIIDTFILLLSYSRKSIVFWSFFQHLHIHTFKLSSRKLTNMVMM